MRPITYKIMSNFASIFIFIKLESKNEKIIARKKIFSFFYTYIIYTPNSYIVKFEGDGDSDIF